MEAMSGVADLVGPALGSVTMEIRIWIPFLLAIISFTLMLIPVALIKDDHEICHAENDSSRITTVPSEETERRPLMRDDDSLTSESSTEAHSTHTYSYFGPKLLIFTVTFGLFFLVSLARDSNNFLIPWVSWRFDETMARVCLFPFSSFFLWFPLFSSVLLYAILVMPVRHEVLTNA